MLRRVVGSLTAVGAWIIGLPSPAALGLLAGMAAFVPIVGAIGGAVPGVLLSVQFGPGNYCDNYDAPFQYPGEKVENLRSTTAECAVWAEDGGMVCYKDWSDTVSNRSTPAEVLELLNWAAAQPREAGVEA